MPFDHVFSRDSVLSVLGKPFKPEHTACHACNIRSVMALKQKLAHPGVHPHFVESFSSTYKTAFFPILNELDVLLEWNSTKNLQIISYKKKSMVN